MTDNSKPREFWIVDEMPYSKWVSSKPVTINFDEPGEVIHVIEYSAYQALQAELEAERKNKSIRRCGECGNVGMSSHGIRYISDMEFELRMAKEKIKELEHYQSIKEMG